jgi:hypothetical protein
MRLLRRHMGRRKRAAYDAAVDRYKKSVGPENITPTPSGHGNFADIPRVKNAAADLCKYLRRR